MKFRLTFRRYRSKVVTKPFELPSAYDSAPISPLSTDTLLTLPLDKFVNKVLRNAEKEAAAAALVRIAFCVRRVLSAK